MNIQTKGWPVHTEDELQAVSKVLASGCTNYWTGSECRQFEKEYAAYVGTPYAVALMNGTVALEAALYALGIGPGDEVIAPSRTFIASASCIVRCGATPIIADVDLDSQNLSVETIEPCITSRTKAIIVVHLAGWPAEMEAILALAHRYNVEVIEDCAQAPGAMINNRPVGSWGRVAAFSFCQDKIITTGGEGGMVTTHDPVIWEKIWSFKDHGKSYQKVHQQHPPGFRWLHDSFGTNWRMTEIQAAIGRLQLKKLPLWLEQRKKNAEVLTKKLKHLSLLRTPLPPSHIKHAYYKYYLFIHPEKLKPGWSRDRIVQEINAREVPCFTGSCSEIYLEQAFIQNDLQPASPRPNAKQLGDTSLMFLIHPSLMEYDMQITAQVVLEVLIAATISL